MTSSGGMGAVGITLLVTAMSLPHAAAQVASGEPEQIAPRLPASLRIEVGGGYDLFSHRFTVVSADSASTLTEGNGQFFVGWSPLREQTRSLELGNRLVMTPDYLYDTATAWLRLGGLQGLSGNADLRWESKRFTSDKPAFVNDHTAVRADLRGAWRGEGRRNLSARLSGEWFDYAQRSSFLYDTRTVGAALGGGLGSWFGPYGDLQISVGSQSVPDSTLLENRRRGLRLTGGWSFFSGSELEGVLWVDDSDYLRAGPRPDRGITAFDLRARLHPLETWSGWFEGNVERQRYAEQTLVYNDGRDLRVMAGPAWRPTSDLEFRFGAGYAVHHAEAVTDTSYQDVFGVTQIVDSWNQPFVMVESTLFTLHGLWALASVEIGRRDYAQDTSFDSDFLYLDFSATAEVPLGRGLALQALVSLSPERHRVPEDNSVTNYTSVDLIWRFR